MYLLNRAPGFSSCGEVKRRRAIQEILSSLRDRLQRQTSSAEAEDAPGNERESAPLPTYEAALWVACQKALQSNLDRLDNELRGRLQAHSQSGNQHRTRSGSQHRTWSRGQHRTQSGSRHRVRTGSPHRECSQGLPEDWQEPKLKIIIKLIPKMNRPIPKTISRNPK